MMRARHTPGLVELVWADMDAGRTLDERCGQFDVTSELSGQVRLWFVCLGCKSLNALTLRPVLDGSGQSWDFNGDMDAPTLSPSIDHRGCWHGFLTNGVFTPC